MRPERFEAPEAPKARLGRLLMLLSGYVRVSNARNTNTWGRVGNQLQTHSDNGFAPTARKIASGPPLGTVSVWMFGLVPVT